MKRLFEVPLKCHWSLLILLFLFVRAYGVNLGFLYCGLTIISVVIHEYAHVWMAQRYGIPVSRVVLMALGAAAMMDQRDLIGEFKKELKMSLAGPLASLALGVVFYIPLLFLPAGVLYKGFYFISIINVAMFLLNMLPIYPMDGGRILNALLSMGFSKKNGIEKGSVKAINVSVIVADILALWLIFACYFYGAYGMTVMFVLVLIFSHIQKNQALKVISEHFNG